MVGWEWVGVDIRRCGAMRCGVVWCGGWKSLGWWECGGAGRIEAMGLFDGWAGYE